jgi:protein-S-isoprenylcysteine O-methyltransferase Ste14
MSIPITIIGLSWLGLWAYWLIAALTAKRAARTFSRRPAWKFRLVLFVVLVILIRLLASAHLHGYALRRVYVPGALAAYIGAVTCFAGVAFAVWARVYIGRNWGMPMSLREGHELVTSGPYAYVRHPIYSGILLALVGTALATAPPVFVVFFLCLGGFYYAARAEERDMTEQFPDAYPAYKQRTKMLIPFLL